MFDDLFTFPIVMIDGENEERKIKDKEKLGLNLGDEEEYDMVYGEACYPYFEFIGIEDRWLPSAESLSRALDGEFEACIVRFLHAGQLLVPWTKDKFKEEIRKFADEFEGVTKGDKKQEFRVLTLTTEQFKKMTEDGDT